MINQPKTLKSVKIYSIICDSFEKDLKYTCERFSNNTKQDLTEQEMMTIYLFAVQEEQRFSVTHIHKYACDYLLDWFAKLGSYDGFSNRLNQLSEAFRCFLTSLLEDLTVFKEAWSEKTNRNFFGDKIYIDEEFFSELEQEINSIMMTPVKGIKGQCQQIKNWDKASDDLFSTAVSRVR